uniref:SD-repeat containing protein B domain-containing protein n=1 Tax=candidate division WOR-3 bacterium TaxID=2052148 RepID=A0A7C4U735_UNCW3
MMLFIFLCFLDTRYSINFTPEVLINEFFLRYKTDSFTFTNISGFYNGNFGIKNASILIEHLSFAKRIYIGDYKDVRGLTIEEIPFHFTPSIIMGKEKDRVGRYFPYFKDNIFIFAGGIKNSFLNSEYTLREDRSIYSPSFLNNVLRNTLTFTSGNLQNKVIFGFCSYSYNSGRKNGYDIEYTFDYKRERFFQVLRFRDISRDFVNERNQYFKDGRIELYSATGYTYPFGWGFRYGFMFFGGYNEINKRFFLNNDSRINGILFNIFGNLEFKEIDRRNIFRGMNITFPYKNTSTSFNYYYTRSSNEQEIFSLNFKYAPFPNGYYYFNLRRETGNRFYTISGFNLPFGSISRLTFEFATLYNNLIFSSNLRVNPSRNSEIISSISYNLNDNRFSLNLEISKTIETKDMGFSGIYGKVFYDKNNNDQFDEGEEVVKDAKIILDEKLKIDVDRNGNYKYFLLSPGEHKLTLQLKGLPSFIGLPNYDFTIISENMKLMNINFPLKGLGSIYGKIFYDKNNNAIFDEDEEGIPNIIVKIEGTDIFTVSDQKGNYRINNLPPNFYQMELSNIPNGYSTNPPGLLIYGYIKEPLQNVEMNIGLIETKKKIRIKRF